MGVPLRARGTLAEPVLPADAVLSKSWCGWACGVGVEYLFGVPVLAEGPGAGAPTPLPVLPLSGELLTARLMRLAALLASSASAEYRDAAEALELRGRPCCCCAC